MIRPTLSPRSSITCLAVVGLMVPEVLALGAAIACPDKKVICLQSDGSGMYCVQALWSHARENANITTLIFANKSYNILKLEMANIGINDVGPRAMSMLNLNNPELNWVKIASSMGVEAEQVNTAEDMHAAMKRGVAVNGPYLIEVII